MRLILVLLTVGVYSHVFATDVVESGEEKAWWEKRHERSDIYFPHNAHMEIMSKSKDVCMACHPFNSNQVTDLKALEAVQTIYNEPLEVICHSCHMQQRTAPLACIICHTDPQTIRPLDHKGDYTWFHTEAARIDEKECRKCHIELSFCSDCHFRRDASKRNMHPLGYRDRHGLEARLKPAECAGCHQPGYCSDCHKGSLR